MQPVIVMMVDRNLLASLQRLLAAVFPRYCVLCAAATTGAAICNHCEDALPWNQVFCECCGQPLPTKQPDGVSCAECQSSSPLFRKCRAPLIYSFPIDHVLKALKYRHQLHYVPAIAAWLLPVLQKEFQHCDALFPVPLNRWRYMKRGFNQAFEICRPLRKASGQRIITTVQRTRATRSQSGLTATERRKNLRDAFAFSEALQCRHPLIVDDVITTGATITQLAKVLLKAGAESVSVMAVARVDQFAAHSGGTSLNV